MFRRGSLLLCGVALGLSALTGVAHAAQGDGQSGDRNGDRGGDRGVPSRTQCGDARERGEQDFSRYGRDSRSSRGDERADERGRARRSSCGGRGGEPGENSSSCGSSLLPSGIGSMSCAAPRARPGRDG